MAGENFLRGWHLCFNSSDYYELFSGVPTGMRISCHLYKALANEILDKKYKIENWMSDSYRSSVISEFILWADDTLMLIGCTSLEALNEAVNAAFRIFKNFESETGIQYHFDKFDILSKHNLKITFRNNTIESKREALYLGYILQQSRNSNFLVGTNHWIRQCSRLSRALPAFYTLNKLLSVPHMLKIYRLYIIPRLFGVTPVSHLPKKILKKIDTLLRKFIGVIWKCHSSMTSPVFINFKKILRLYILIQLIKYFSFLFFLFYLSKILYLIEAANKVAKRLLEVADNILKNAITGSARTPKL